MSINCSIILLTVFYFDVVFIIELELTYKDALTLLIKVYVLSI